MIKLDKRLQAILSHIDCDTVADIGCDHGKLIVSAIKNGKALTGFAIDISAQSLKKAQLLAQKYNVADKIDFLVADGFMALTTCVNTAVIAGMGAREIVKILKQKDIADKYILVPHQDTHYLRKYLAENGFWVTHDYMIKEQKFYAVIVAKKGESNYSQAEIYLGKNLPSSGIYSKWLSFRYNTIAQIIKNAGIDAIDSDLKNEWEELCQWLNL